MQSVIGKKFSQSESHPPFALRIQISERTSFQNSGSFGSTKLARESANVHKQPSRRIEENRVEHPEYAFSDAKDGQKLGLLNSSGRIGETRFI